MNFNQNCISSWTFAWGNNQNFCVKKLLFIFITYWRLLENIESLKDHKKRSLWIKKLTDQLNDNFVQSNHIFVKFCFGVGCIFKFYVELTDSIKWKCCHIYLSSHSVGSTVWEKLDTIAHDIITLVNGRNFHISRYFNIFLNTLNDIPDMVDVRLFDVSWIKRWNVAKILMASDVSFSFVAFQATW